MKALPQISEAEYEVMKVIWHMAPVSTTEVTARLTASTDWSPKTIQTMLKRLVQKGALTYEKNGRVFVYTPLVSETEYRTTKSKAFLNRFYDGKMAAMVSAYLDQEQISEQELDELRSLLQKREQEHR